MKRRDLNVIFCHQSATYMHLSQEKTKELLSYFFVWKWESYTDYLYHLETLKTEVNSAGLVWDSCELLNCYLDEAKKLEMYQRLLSFITKEGAIKKAPEYLGLVENRLNLNKQDTQRIRDQFIRNKYLKDADLKKYTQAILSSLMISLGNDGVLDKEEFDNCIELLSGVRRFCPEFPIHSFDLSNALGFIEIPKSEMQRLKKSMVSAIKADGRVDASEISLLRQMSKTLSLNEDSNLNVERILPFCALAVLFSDGEITLKEKQWFIDNFDCERVIESSEEAFWFLSIVTKFPKIVREQQWFLSMLWNREKDFYDFTNRLFINFAKYFLKFDSATYESTCDYLIYDSSKKFKEILCAHKSGKVVEEELLLLLNIVFNDRYDLSVMNEFFTHDYLTRVFKALKIEDNPLMYYSAAQSLFSDQNMNNEEYEILWKNFEGMHLDVNELKSAIYDLSLYKQRELKINDYYTYLREQA